ncbi:MAG: prephenate dehydrogenase/arogenate dehydrogenase family protein [Anaerolineae bacterium]|nr:prephenate dehydrogenase/arogenate dehydrogenase family protein [Anaerolineae bacterium]
MAQTITVTIIGLGRLGASVGLALQRYNQKGNTPHVFEILGVEDRPAVMAEAEKRGAVGKSARNLYNAVQNRDIIVLALPYADVRRTYQAIGDGIRAGGVVMDLSPLAMPSVQWAKEYLSKDAHMISMTPVVNPAYLYDGLDDTEHAAADLFDKGSMMLMPSPACIPEAIELASDFSTLLGATVRFMDPMEHDALIGATLGLPTLLGVLSFYTLSHNAGWSDLQRVTNPPFGRLTHALFDTHPDDLRDLWLNSRHSLVNQLDLLIEQLTNVRQVLAEEDRSALEAVLTDAADQYSAWINKRHNNKWDDDPRTPRTPSTTESLMSGLMGGALTKRLRGGDKNES